MKKLILMLALSFGFTVMPTQKTHAIVWVVVKAAIKKAIIAIDLQVQRLQNKTIWLQNAQKTLENTMSKLQLTDISDWVNKHKEQYAQYFDELNKVKETISGFTKVKEIMQRQVQIVDEYKRAIGLFKQDKHFTTQEIDYMGTVYTGIVDESLKNIDQLFLVINSFATKMSDGKRLEVINGVAGHLDENLNDLRLFNTQNIKLSLQRSRDQAEIDMVKSLYQVK